MKRKRIDIITLGCSKNLVDSEQLMRQLEEAGYSVTHDTEKPEGEIAVINTCGFIGDAKEESINMILEFAERKEEGDLKKLFVMGCLSERYLQELAIEIPQVDKFYGKFNWKELLHDLGKTYHEELYIERTLTTPKHYAYLKISEGCDRKCSYCAIPIITGHHISKPIEEILDDSPDMMNEAVGKRAQPSDTTGKSTNPQRTGMITAKSINGKMPQATPGFVITTHLTNRYSFNGA